MSSLVFCMAFLFVSSLALEASDDTPLPLDADLKTWSRLKREAGYYTESGKWRGGLYGRSRSTETKHYTCLNHTDTHCTDWSVSERNSNERKREVCKCEETTAPFCQNWTCSTRLNHTCSSTDNSRACAAQESLNCSCVQPAVNFRYCWMWQCHKGSSNPDGRQEGEVYQCLVGDLTAEYCYRWHWNIASKNRIESAACECSERDRGFCQSWRCKERGITRCEQSSLGWCRLEFAIGLGGGMGLFLFLFGVIGLQLHLAKSDLKLQGTHVLICFVVLCLPWSVGVVIWGGMFAFPWVFSAWSAAFLAVFLSIKLPECIRRRKDAKRRKAKSYELPNIEPLKIQRPRSQQPIVVRATMDSTDVVRNKNINSPSS